MVAIDSGIAQLIRDLDDRQRTVFLANCIDVLRREDNYDAPLIASWGERGKKVVELIQELASGVTESPNLMSESSAVYSTLQSALFDQYDKIESAKKLPRSSSTTMIGGLLLRTLFVLNMVS